MSTFKNTKIIYHGGLGSYTLDLRHSEFIIGDTTVGGQDFQIILPRTTGSTGAFKLREGTTVTIEDPNGYINGLGPLLRTNANDVIRVSINGQNSLNGYRGLNKPYASYMLTYDGNQLWTLVQGGSGANGDTGPQGAQGNQGPTGLQGSAGAQGNQGPTGAQGIIGSQGNQGPTGAQGITGAQGNQGPTGLQGTTGAQGNQGPFGQQGFQGRQGPAGPQGVQGPAGLDGIAGSPGIQGAAGSNGANGSPGPQGVQGPTGPQGNQGSTGPQGNQGPTGPQGNQGPTGPQGSAGPQGNQGPTGPQGNIGTQGRQGPTGPQGTNGSDAIISAPHQELIFGYDGGYWSRPSMKVDENNGFIYANAFYQNSSRALKTNITEYTDSAIDLLNQVNVVTFNYKEDLENKHIGFIAEDTPIELSTKNQNTMDTNSVVGVLIKAVQELQAEIERLRNLYERN